VNIETKKGGYEEPSQNMR